MLGLTLLLPAVLSLLFGAVVRGDNGNRVQTISAVGSKFFYEDGTQYYIKGTDF